MTDDLHAALAAHDDFEADDGGFEVRTATFDARVTVGDDGFRLTVAAPTLDAAVVDETVPRVIQDDWLETLRRRLADVGGVTRTDGVETPVVERDGETVFVDVAVEDAGPTPASDAKALVTFVEGTWFQGVIPGYDYREPVSSVRQRAYEQGGSPS